MQLKFWRHDLKLTHPWRIASGVGDAGASEYPVVFVELRDAAGRVGLGESAPSSRYQENVQTVQTFLAQVNPARLSFDDPDASLR